MYKIGEFSILSKTTIKTLRYYEKEQLLTPAYINKENGYRYYSIDQLSDITRILFLREIGLSIKDIKEVLNGYDLVKKLENRKIEINKNIELEHIQLSKINKVLEEKNMEKEIIIKDIPKYTVYYKEGVIKDYSEMPMFVLGSGTECLELNPNIKCIEPDYCFITYLDEEYKEKDIKIRYSQAVEEKGIENDNIKFVDLEPVKAVCIYHKGTYSKLAESYNIIMKYIESNNYKMIDKPRECYIDGCWNKEKEEDYLTEIQIPIK